MKGEITMHDYRIEYIPQMGAYRLYEHGYVGWTVAYLDSLEEAAQRASEDGDRLTYIDEDNRHHVLVDA